MSRISRVALPMSCRGYTDDALLGGRIMLRQPSEGYRVALEPILLAAAVTEKKSMRVLDAGCGSGAAMLCLAARVSDCRVVGLELQSTLETLAGQSIAMNRLNDRLSVVQGDIIAPPSSLGKTAFDVVMSNPPFGEAGTPPPNSQKAAAHMEQETSLSDWINALLRLLTDRGQLVLIHRANRLTDIIAPLQGRAGGITICPIWPKAGQPAKRVIVSAFKGRKSPDRLVPGVTLHEADGSYTAQLNTILRDAGAINL